MSEQIARDFLMLLVTIDPIGTLSIFVPLTSAIPQEQRFRVALRAVLVAGAVMLAFLVGGQLLLSGLGIRLVSFQLAGGIILFLLGLQMVFGTGIAKPPEPEQDRDVAVFPLAIPSIASPGAIMAVVLLTDNHRHSMAEQAVTAAVLLAVLLLTLALLALANPIHRVLGFTGASVAIRVMGLLLCALAAEQVAAGLAEMIQEMGIGPG